VPYDIQSLSPSKAPIARLRRQDSARPGEDKAASVQSVKACALKKKTSPDLKLPESMSALLDDNECLIELFFSMSS
ncbi:MAG TPA: hypothetical protein VIX18_10895, partial [Nitrospirota bacterium]